MNDDELKVQNVYLKEKVIALHNAIKELHKQSGRYLRWSEKIIKKDVDNE